MLVCIPGKVATVATVVTLRRFRRRAFFMRIILIEFSITAAQIPHFFCPLRVQFLFTDPWFFLQTPGTLISRKFTREGGAVGWNTITGI